MRLVLLALLLAQTPVPDEKPGEPFPFETAQRATYLEAFQAVEKGEVLQLPKEEKRKLVGTEEKPLRIIPGMTVLRPADAEESVLAWQMAIEKKDGPTALALTRQNLDVFPKKDPSWKENARKGAYIADDSEGAPRIVIVASGSVVL